MNKAVLQARLESARCLGATHSTSNSKMGWARRPLYRSGSRCMCRSGLPRLGTIWYHPSTSGPNHDAGHDRVLSSRENGLLVFVFHYAVFDNN